MVHQTEFSQAPSILETVLQGRRLDGFLLDLGVSSPQLDEADRGFSYRQDGPLDMRMDPTQGKTAADVVNDYPPGELIDVLVSYGDERHAKRIVRAILAHRPFQRTVEFADVVTSAIPAAARRTGGHPATRTFQALRIEVNQELAMLGPTLEAMMALLGPNGLGLVLTYHSGEDRIAKDRMRSAIEGDAPAGLGLKTGYAWGFRGAKQPSDAEIETNPRARSARLRAIRRVDAES